MNGPSLRKHRQQVGWTQAQMAARLGVTQAYLSLMERGKRRISDRVVREATRRLRLPATLIQLPDLTSIDASVTEPWLEQGLSRLGYPGFAYRKKPGARRNPVELLLRALALDDLDPRLAEALPWLLLEFDELDFKLLADQARMRNLQNRLGFVVALARQVAERSLQQYRHRLGDLRQFEASLEPSRLAREDTFGREETNERMRAWLRDNRSEAADHWNILSDLKVEHLPYASQDRGALAELPS